jgi:hypothetical protein
MRGFVTIKASAWRTPYRGLSAYRNSETIQLTIVSKVSETDSFTDSRNTGFIQHHLLVVKSVGSPQGLSTVFVSRRKIVSSAHAGNVPPYEKASPVYMEVR